MPAKGRPKKLPAEEKIAAALGAATQHIETESENKELISVSNNKEEIKTNSSLSEAYDDKDFARQNIKKLLNKGTELLEGISALSIDGEHPRNYEVASTLIKVLIEGSRDLLALQKDIKIIEKESGILNEKQNTGQSNLTIQHADKVENVILEATTLELLEFVENSRKKKDTL